MKEFLAFAFLFVLYTLLGLNIFATAPGIEEARTVSWTDLGKIMVLFLAAGTAARWSVMAFKRRPGRLLAGQKIVGVEEPSAGTVLGVVKPEQLEKESTKPRLKKRRLL